jgi:2-dehydro-3-deoxygalactonokinase
MENRLLSCDWGTSSFRLKLVDRNHHQVAGEIFSEQGTALIYNEWKTWVEQQGVDREQFYFQKLQQHIDKLSEKLAISLSGLPVLMSGMIGSSIGVKELPYASLPFLIDGSGAIVHEFATVKDFGHPVWLISGISSEGDVMRGEETQMIGLACMEPEIYAAGTSVCIFPGTHSKHIRIKDGAIIDFKTFMTGELFHIIAHHSILKDSVEGLMNRQWTGLENDAFCKGVRQSGESNLLHNLFPIRVNHLFGRSQKRENLFQLSGLLIGTELRSLLWEDNLRIRLCSGSHASGFYQLALKTLNMEEQTIFIAPEKIDRSASEGHIKILQHAIG